MADLGATFRDEVVKYINSWGENLEVLIEVNVGARFIGTPRRIDVVIRNKDNNKYIGIECKVQFTDGTAYEKLSYALYFCSYSRYNRFCWSKNQRRYEIQIINVWLWHRIEL